MKKQLEFGSEHGFPEIKKGKNAEFSQDAKMMLGVSEMYKESKILQKINTRRDQGKTPFVLFSDIDGTFHHEEMLPEMLKLKEALDSADMGLVLVTARRDSNKNLSDTPHPDALIQAVGTEVYIRKGNEYILDEEFSKMIERNWDREKIFKALQSVISQNEQWQTKVRTPAQDSKWEVVSFFTGAEQDLKMFIAEIEKNLPMAGEIRAKIIYWENHKPNSFNFFVGIIPEKSGKVEAINHLHTKLGKIDGLVAGDSRIDSDMILQSGFPAVIVGDSKPSLISESVEQSEPLLFNKIRDLKDGQWLYTADQEKQETKGSGGIITALKTGMFLRENIYKDLAKNL